MTITKLPAPDDPIYGPLQTKLARGVMVQWINDDLYNRAGCDVRKSIVLWTADRHFVMALPASLTEQEFLARVGAVEDKLAQIGVAYYSKGIK